MTWAALKDLLLTSGEPLSAADLDAFLVALIGSDSKSIPEDVDYDAQSFSEQLLGFEEHDPTV